ncbi:MAG TPA: hypothetical protein PKZ97_18835 [Azospirillaceae bacterium]|nr:hypothetical protein [Azospirillaceae bacterium]
MARWIGVAPGVELLVEQFSPEIAASAAARLQRLVANLQRRAPPLTDLPPPAAFAFQLYCTALAQVAVVLWRGAGAPILADGAAAGGALADIMSNPDVAARFLRRWRGATVASAVRREIVNVVGLGLGDAGEEILKWR